MYRIIFFLYGLLISLTSYSQDMNDIDVASYDSLWYKYDWTFEHNHFGDSIVTLVPLTKWPTLDTFGLAMEQKKSRYLLWLEQTDRLSAIRPIRRIHFDSSGKFHYYKFSRCDVGDRICEVINVTIRGATLKAVYRNYNWDADINKVTVETMKYKIDSVSKFRITLIQ